MNNGRAVAPHTHFHVAPWDVTFGCGFSKLMLAGAAMGFASAHAALLPGAIGWLIMMGGVIEIILSWTGRDSWIGRLAFGSGAATVILGAIFIESRWAGLFPLTQFVVVWLLFRGFLACDVAVLSRSAPNANWRWLLARGTVDLGLGLTLLLGAPMAMLAWLMFGATPEMIGTFCLVLAVSFAVSGAGLIAIAIAHKSVPVLG
jgi:uncharacterized membrane protein HdeD (DUF308 family)